MVRLAILATLLAGTVAPLRLDAQSDSGGVNLTPFPFFFYTPETNLAFGATLLAFTRLDGSVRTSRLQPTFVYTTKNQIILSVFTEAFLQHDETRIFADVSYMRFPNTFWGVGNESPDAAEEDYTPRSVAFTADVQRSVGPGWFLGLNTRVTHRKLMETVAGGLLATQAVAGTEDGLVIQFGLSAARDTRDHVSYPRSGSYYPARLTRADGMVGSDFDYTTFEFDLRQYFRLFDQHVLVVRGYTTGITGTAPFDLLPQIGGEIL